MTHIIARILTLAGERRRQIITGFVLSFIDSVFESFPLLAVFMFLSAIAKNQLDHPYIIFLTVFLLLGLTGRCICRYLIARLQSGTGFMMIADERLTLADRLRYAPMSFFDHHHLGDIANCATSDIGYVELYSMFALDKVTSGLLMTILTSIFLLFFDWRAGAAGMLGMIPAWLIFRYLQHTGKQLAPRRQHIQAELSSAVLEYAKGFMTLKALGSTRLQSGRIHKAFGQSEEQSFKLEKQTVPLVSLLTTVTKLTGCCIILITGAVTLRGELKLPAAIMLSIAGFTLYHGLEQCAGLSTMLRLMEASLDRVEQLMTDIKTEPTPDSIARPADSEVRFEQVSFGYDSLDVLHNVSFTVKPGSTLALVGHSGCGKSTITKLLCGFYRTERGQISIGGVNISDLSEDQLLANISMVFQNVYLFSDTILNNIRFAKPEATMAEIISACKKACCYDFIMALKDQFETVVGEGGGTLSGGEKQRLSIARAILKDAPIILLDEATSSVDPENEYLIQQAISNLIQGKTLITIAHNLSAIKMADQILVLNRGRIAEQGTHEELLALAGIYSEMWQIRNQINSWKLV